MTTRRAFRVRCDRDGEPAIVSSQYSLRRCRALAREWKIRALGGAAITAVTIEQRPAGATEWTTRETVWRRQS